MLAFPFLSAAALAQRPRWLLLPAALAALAAFCLREPLTVLGRQTLVWRHPRPESRAALRFAAACSLLLAGSGALLAAFLEARLVAALAAGAALLTGLNVGMTVRNRQRSPALQVAGAAGLSASCLLAWLAARNTLDATAFWLWAAHSAYNAGAVLAVHARLEARVAARRDEGSRAPARTRLWAVIAQAGLLALAGICLGWGQPALSVPLALAAAVHLIGLWRLGRPDSLAEPLRRVGFRALGLSVVFSVLALLALWRQSSQSS